MNPGGLQKRAELLQAPRTTDSEDHSHDRREIVRRATIIKCRFATLASPRSHVRLAPPVLQTRAKDRSASSLRSRESCLLRWTPIFGRADKVEL